MKKLNRRLFSGLLLVCMMLSMCCSFASAAQVNPDSPQSSAYLDSYGANVTVKSSGIVRVSVSVDARVYTTEVGAKIIYLYESTNGTSFTKVATFNSSNHPDMLCSGWSYDDTPIEYQGVAGRYYWAAVKCYAGDSTGSDYRWYNTPTAH